MNSELQGIWNPHSWPVYTLAPRGLTAPEADRISNAFLALAGLPLAQFHDHFIGDPGGLAWFAVETPEARDALLSQQALRGWKVDIRSLIFSRGRSGLHEQIAFTQRA